MRRAAACASSSMQALVSVSAAAAAGSRSAVPAAPPAAQQLDRRQQQAAAGTRPQRWRHYWPGGGWQAASGGFAPSFSSRARQRRLIAAAAAAQPALVIDAPAEVQAPDMDGPASLGDVLPQLEQPWRQPSPARSALEAAAAAAAAVEAPPAQARLAADPPFRLPVPNLGYTCMNVELKQLHGTRTNRSCRRKTFDAEGLPCVSRLALANCQDLLPIVEWNRRRGIHFFRVPSALFPWSHEYQLEQLPDYEEIAATLAAVGAAARAARQRLTSHPTHFVQLAAPDAGTLRRSLGDLELASQVFDLMGYAPSPENKVNIHVGYLRGRSKTAALGAFAAAADLLSDACRARLTVENDDRPSLFSIADLLPLHRLAGIPLVFDYLHHALVPGGLSEQEALEAALATWPAGVRPVVHYSEPSENPALPRRAHSRMLTRPFSLYGHEAEVDVMLEAKGMDRALVFYRDELQLGRKVRTEPVHAGAHGRARAAQALQHSLSDDAPAA